MRTSIPDDVAARVLHSHDRTCSVCTIRGRRVQIHHIDEDHANHDFDNLTILCLDCHAESQIKGGFARKLGDTEVRLHRGEWMRRVAERRARADELLVAMQVGATAANTALYEPWMKPSEQELVELVQKIPDIMREAEEDAAPRIDSGVTAEMVEGTYSIIEVMRGILVRLGTWYPPRHFGGKTPDQFFEELESSKFGLYWSLYDNGDGLPKGSILKVIVAGTVLEDMKGLLETAVEALIMDFDTIDLVAWRERFRRTSPQA